ncbi:carboxylesterase [Mycena epipterygia]|nr:carboxylesterase [Mycena epipterygia]
MSSLFQRCVLVSSLVAVALSTSGWPSFPGSFQLPFTLPQAGWSTASPRVSIGQGTIVGSVLRDASAPQAVEAFRGIPYALPPVDDRRFRPAVPVGASRAKVYATEFGARCPGKQLLQLPGSDGKESEDCLTLNVFRPNFQSGQEKLPVAVYIHGGAFNRGTAAMHDTASMVAWSETPFVAVSFNYRIGALGFLPSGLSHKEGILNLGLKDQVMVMEWVQENIAQFGGDPGQVTLFGLSAGAHSIGHHVMNFQETSPLFHRVIIESGAPTSRAVHAYDASIHETQFLEFLAEAGCGNPVIDGEIISGPPIDGWESGEWNKVPIMTGFSHNEGTYYVPASMSEPEQFIAFFRLLIPRLSKSDLETIDELYPDPSTHPDSPYADARDLAAIQVGPQFKRVEAAYAQYAYICPVRQTAHYAAPNQAAPVYLYHWTLNQTVKGGANHGDHIGYQTMDAGVLGYSEAQREVAWSLHAYWTSFITTGNPNSIRGRAAGRAEWARYDTKDPRVMVFGEGNDERAGGNGVGTAAKMQGDEWSRKECDFWWTKTRLSEA